MPQNRLIQARINADIKEQASEVLANIGLTVSDVVRMLLTKVANDKAVPFDLLTPNDTSIHALKEAEDRNLPRFDSIDALMDDLHAED